MPVCKRQDAKKYDGCTEPSNHLFCFSCDIWTAGAFNRDLYLDAYRLVALTPDLPFYKYVASRT